jgi:hypothetical protein
MFLFLPFYNAAQADTFDGIWRGTGSVQAPDGSGKNDCPTAAFAIEQTPTSLVIKKGEFQCGAINSSWSPVSFEIQGNNLVVAETNQIYGHIDDSTFSFHFVSGVITWDAYFELLNGTLNFHDLQSFGPGEALVTEGVFAKSLNDHFNF